MSGAGVFTVAAASAAAAVTVKAIQYLQVLEYVLWLLLLLLQQKLCNAFRYWSVYSGWCCCHCQGYCDSHVV